MTIVEKAAYLKGLTEGLGIEGSKEGKLWGVLCELLSDMAHEIEDLQETSGDFAEVIDEISEELSYLEELTCDLDMPEDSCASCTGCCGCDDDDEDEDDDDDDDDDEDEDDEDDDFEPEFDGILYDVTCPVCGEEITFDEETLEEGSIRCPNCGELLEFDLSEEEEDEDEESEDKD